MRLGYVILYVRDVEASLSFYERAFGLERRFVAEGGEYGELETGGTALGFVSEALVAPLGSRRLRPDEAPPGVEVGLVTDDVAEAVARAVAAGAALAAEPVVKPWGQVVAYVRDLDGLLVELCTAVAG